MLTRRPDPIDEMQAHLVGLGDKITVAQLDTASDILLATADMRGVSDSDGLGMGTAAALAMVDLPTAAEATGLPQDILYELGGEVPEDVLVTATHEYILARDAFVVALAHMKTKRRLRRLPTGLVDHDEAHTAFLIGAQILRDEAARRRGLAGGSN